VRSFDGTVTIMQPLIAPLYDGRTAHELLAAFIDAQNGKSAHDLVKDYWTRAHGGKVGNWTITDANGQAFATPDAFWKHALHDGFVTGTASGSGTRGAGRATSESGMRDAASVSGVVAAPATSGATTTPESASRVPDPASRQGSPASASEASASGLEIIFRPDPTIWDGRFANNGWLQELPKPLTKITWDPAAWISPRTAEQKGLSDGDLVELRYRGNTAKLPVAIVPGHPDNAVTAFFGYGRQRVGRVGTPADDQAKAFDVFRLRTSDAPWFGAGLEIVKAGRYVIARTQEHHLMEGRHPVRAGTLKEYEENPMFIAEMGETPPKAFSLIPAWEYNSYRWGMAIDLSTCTGCSTCIVACVAENNIPVVGKDQVHHGREMHWIRVDHYFAGNPEEPSSIETHHQPVPCMQCETAPCELVCPVGATTHSAEGLNDMIYNRCVGTRYCSNNCPYKVRRFNFLEYNDYATKSLRLMRNPDVSVRSRGVMEKCTYCVQRINSARIEAKKQDRRIQDGEIIPACAQACPADAIVFGDLNDPNSAVTKLKAQQRNYGLLDELNTRPRTTYLAALRNPNPELEPSRGTASRTDD
jgi:molybdopterin-containing oxidoreductase family iron-sulfur binding subunit